MKTADKIDERDKGKVDDGDTEDTPCYVDIHTSFYPHNKPRRQAI